MSTSREEMAATIERLTRENAAIIADRNRLSQDDLATIERLTRERDEARASCASLREAKDTFFRNAEAWEVRAESLSAQLAKHKEALAKIFEADQHAEDDGKVIIEGPCAAIARAALAAAKTEGEPPP